MKSKLLVHGPLNCNGICHFLNMHNDEKKKKRGEGFSPHRHFASSPHQLFSLLLALIWLLSASDTLAEMKCEIVRQEDFLREDGIEGYLKELFFVDPSNGWAVGDTGLIVRTSDGGKSWTLQKSEARADLWCVYFRDSNHGWAIGTSSTILKTDNGGNTWQATPRPSGSAGAGGGGGFGGGPRLVSMTFFGDKGWIVGDDQTILSSSDTGGSWALAGGGGRFRIGDVRRHLNAVHFVNENLGWVVGTNGKIMTTQNAGKEWTTVDTGKYNNLEGVYFVNENEGWIVGQEGIIFHTSDGGKSWTTQASKTEETLYDVHFFDSKNGIIVGEYGTVLYTSDGGASWKKQNSNTKNTLFGLSALDKDHIWATGEWGIVIKIQL